MCIRDRIMEFVEVCCAREARQSLAVGKRKGRRGFANYMNNRHLGHRRGGRRSPALERRVVQSVFERLNTPVSFATHAGVFSPAPLSWAGLGAMQCARPVP